jgi:hypothetical protein
MNPQESESDTDAEEIPRGRPQELPMIVYEIESHLIRGQYYERDLPIIRQYWNHFTDNIYKYSIKTIRWFIMNDLELSSLKPPDNSSSFIEYRPEERHHIVYYRFMEMLYLLKIERDSLCIRSLWEDFLWIVFSRWNTIIGDHNDVIRFYKAITSSMITSEYSGTYPFWIQVSFLGILFVKIYDFYHSEPMVFTYRQRTCIISQEAPHTLEDDLRISSFGDFIRKNESLYTILYDGWIDYQTLQNHSFVSNLCFCPKLSKILNDTLGFLFRKSTNPNKITCTESQLTSLRDILLGIELMKQQCMYRGTNLMSIEQEQQQEQEHTSDSYERLYESLYPDDDE